VKKEKQVKLWEDTNGRWKVKEGTIEGEDG
jgi:hypothetical protein